jgi:DNA-binding IclR family transcriptional regulator
MSSLENIFRILDLLDRRSPELSVREVAKKLGIPKSSVSRMLSALTKAGYLDRTRQATFVAGHRARALGELFLDRHPGLHPAEQAVSELVGRYGFSGFVSKLVGNQNAVLNVTRGACQFPLLGYRNELRPAIDTAAGTAMLSRMPDANVLRLVGDLPEPQLEGLLVDMQVARNRQLVYKPSTRLSGVTAVATVVPQQLGNDDLSICLCWPDAAVDAPLMAKMTEHLMRSVEMLEADD